MYKPNKPWLIQQYTQTCTSIFVYNVIDMQIKACLGKDFVKMHENDLLTIFVYDLLIMLVFNCVYHVQHFNSNPLCRLRDCR